MKTLQIVDFEKFRDRFDAQYAEAQWHSGVPAGEVALEIRRIYGRGELRREPYALTKARMLEYALANIRVAYHDFDSFATVCERTAEIARIAGERNSIISEQALGPEEWSKKCAARADGYFNSTVDMSHTSPDWDAILTLGVPGLLARAEQRQRISPSPFYEAVVITFRAMRTLLRRFADAAAAQGRPDTAEMAAFLIDHAPETLQQALELGMIYREVQEMEGEMVRSMGIFDRQYLPFYEHDLACGILTERSAEELLLIYFSRCHAQSQGQDAGVPFCFGGRLPDGRDGCNALTLTALRAFRRLKLVDPKFHIRVNDGTPAEVLDLAFSCVKEGTSAILFANEDVVRQAFLRNGKAPEDLANFVPIGCYEPAIMGKELCCSMTGTFNLAKTLESLMDPAFAPRDFAAVLDRFISLQAAALNTMMDRINIVERHWSEINPTTAISGTMTECMERGIDAAAGGTKYRSSGIMCAGIGTVTDALAAIE
ncbi:MAG: pyruvate formate lyase family protein, partial [Lentisphaeria bacterium]|nr:pyruvate formate lyase family protein [Lentisphaeria bacterium]